MTSIAIIPVLFLAVSIPALAENESGMPGTETFRVSDEQQFQVQFTSKLNPVVINTLHTWILHIENRSGEPAANAVIQVSGGMPEHDHGLPTRPRVTENLGDGNYLLEGLKFHMGGLWQVTLSIQQGAVSDSVTFDLNL